MKEGLYAVEPAPPGSRPDLDGLSCRWSPIPSRRGEIVSVIAVPEQGADMAAFTALINDIVHIAAMQERGGHPVPPEGPTAHLTGATLDLEARAAAPRNKRLGRKLKIMGIYLLAQFLDRFRIPLGEFEPRRYKRDVAANSDFRKFDDGLKMTVDVDPESLRRIEAKLEAAARAHVCRYGLHRQDAAIMTCYVVSPMQRNHMHFIDGASGGYALASTRLKGMAASAAAAPSPNAMATP